MRNTGGQQGENESSENITRTQETKFVVSTQTISP